MEVARVIATTRFTLADLPPGPTGRRPQIRRARRYLSATHHSVSGVLDSFTLVRDVAAKTRGTAAGRLSRDQLDLLRAALIFTSSGLDATCQTLVRECAPVLIAKAGTAHDRFEFFLDQEMKRPSESLIAAVKDPSPRERLIELYLDVKTRASYQGTGDLKSRVRDLLGIPNATLTTAKINSLSGFFTARNDIVHQLDYVDPTSASSKRHHRAPSDVVAECDRVLALVNDMIRATADLL
jgi:hypothetical protein